jgi:hypothetical protein
MNKEKVVYMSQGQHSPITGIISETDVIIDFGKHEGLKVSDLQLLDPDFYAALANEKGEGVYAIRRHRDKTFRLYLNPLAQMDQ